MSVETVLVSVSANSRTKVSVSVSKKTPSSLGDLKESLNKRKFIKENRCRGWGEKQTS
jgi:hypothetical protein